ncbi:MAG: tRNA lysidine(34) synthetase TilS [Chitinophagaceae bacterium]
MEKLLINFKEYIQREKLPLTGSKLLCALSGGMDSVVMVHLLREMGIEMEFAHANFQLRDQESIRDELFVQSLAQQFNVRCHIKKFDTKSYAEQHKISIQIAARELRYSWFSEIIESNPHLKFICTAHHADDNVETLLMNLFKGTGMQGLRGIPVRNEKIIRPILFASKDEIKNYAIKKGLQYVEDSSNLLEKYTRNYFRLKVIPLIKEVFPEVDANLRDNLVRFREAEILYRDAVQMKMKKLLYYEVNGTIKIPIEKLRLATPLYTMVYEIFSQWGFYSAQIEEIIKLMDRQTGKVMLSQSHQILKNRNWLIITPITTTSSWIIPIASENVDVIFDLGKITCSDISNVKQLDAGKNRIIVDADKISFPLVIRKWKAGDYFYPLGMKKKKKIARFLIDQKLSLIEKERVWVLESDKKILWVIGLRMDDRFQIQSGTKKMLEFSLKS